MFEIIILSLIMFTCAFIQGFAGFAFSLVLIPLLGFFFEFHEIVVLNLIFSFILNFSVFLKIRKHAKIREVAVLILFALVFTVIGAKFITTVNDSTLKVILGVLLIVSSVLNIFQIRLTLNNYKKYYPVVGAVTGVLNGMSGISGPPLILFFSNVKMDKLTYKATFNTIFLSLNIIAITTYALMGNIDKAVMKISATYGIVVIVGAYAGMWFSSRVSEKVFKKVVIFIVLVMGISMIVGELWR